jgi:hypothetical protein
VTRDLSNYRTARPMQGAPRPGPNPPREFPRGTVNDLFPLSVVPERVVARTVFTAYTIPQRTPTSPHAPAIHAALCACGDTRYADSEAYLRKVLGEHSCVDERGRPIELVPVDDDLDVDVLDRVLDGLRRLS